jgi:ribosome maturation factor RimP
MAGGTWAFAHVFSCEEVTAMTADPEVIRERVAPIVASLGLDVYDVELSGSGHSRAVRIVVAHRDAGAGVDLDLITDATRILAPELGAAGLLRDSDVLEVSSPGLERTLRRPEHFRAATGERVSVKHTVDGETVREHGVVVAADDAAFDVELDDGAARRIAYADVAACRTVFEWGPAPRPGRGSKPGKGGAARSQGGRTKETSRS